MSLFLRFEKFKSFCRLDFADNFIYLKFEKKIPALARTISISLSSLFIHVDVHGEGVE